MARGARRSNCSGGSWPKRTVSDVNRAINVLYTADSITLPQGRNWILREKSQAAGVQRPQFDISITVYVEGVWVPATIRHHRPISATTPSGPTGIQVARGFAAYASQAQEIWVHALTRGRAPLTTTPVPAPAVRVFVDLTDEAEDPPRAMSLDLNLSPPATPSDDGDDPWHAHVV